MSYKQKRALQLLYDVVTSETKLSFESIHKDKHSIDDTLYSDPGTIFRQYR
jgi:hypothetical protein